MQPTRSSSTRSPIVDRRSGASSSVDPRFTDPLGAFGVGSLHITDVRATAVQQLSARFADHRGRIDLPVLGVLVDHIGGAPFAARVGGAAMQARLGMSASTHFDVDALAQASADLVMHDDRSGITRFEVGDTSRLCCSGSARSMRVGRTVPPSPELLQAFAAPPPEDAADVDLPDPIPADLPGADIVAAISSGDRAPGPLVEMLNGRIEPDSESSDLRLTIGTERWMGNAFGTMHGGVITTIVGHACSLAGQSHAAPGADYTVGELTVAFLRSPAVDGAPVHVDVDARKVGRRVAVFAARMTDADGILLADAAADIHFT